MFQKKRYLNSGERILVLPRNMAKPSPRQNYTPFSTADNHPVFGVVEYYHSGDNEGEVVFVNIVHPTGVIRIKHTPIHITQAVRLSFSNVLPLVLSKAITIDTALMALSEGITNA